MNAPKGAVTPELKAELATRREELVAFLTRSIPNAPRDRPPPASFSQERLWLLDQLEPKNPVYNVGRGQWLRGELDLVALRRALHGVVSRHESLRTTFQIDGGNPVQKITEDPSIDLNVVDLQCLPEGKRGRAAQELANNVFQNAFDLSRGPLLRATLIRLGKSDHILVALAHHIVCDGWSIRILTRELWTLYTGLLSNTRPSLPDLPVQHADYAAWEREALRGEVLEAKLRYWKHKLGGDLPSLHLPLERPRPPVETFKGARHPLVIPGPLTEALRHLARDAGVTLFVTLLAAYKTLLHRYTQQEDMVVGCPIANRSHTALENLIGLFVNTLVLRTDLSGNPSFRQLLGRLNETTLTAYEHHDVPFEKIVEELKPPRDLSRNPIFQTMFILQNAPRPDLRVPLLEITPVVMDSGTSKFDITVALAETKNGLLGSLEYRTDLFTGGTIRQMIGHFERLLEAVVADPDRPISTLPLLTEGERRQLLFDWNATDTGYPKDLFLQDLFQAQVEQTPDTVALVCGDHHLTYGQLNARSNQLARHLRSLGVSPEVSVGLCLERSPELMIGLLAILKAGGAYLPLDPSYPKERLSYMIQDARLSVLLTQNRFPLAASSFPKIVNLDADWTTIAQESTETLTTHLSPENLAYTLYTSGSTGKPKGVQIPHRALLNFLTSMQNTPGLNEKDALLSVTTLSFDIAALELFLPLLSGATVILSSTEEALEGKELAAKLRDSQASLMQATPSTWKLLLETGWKPEKHLRIFSGGEALPKDLADALLKNGNPLWNLYGPTETTVWSSVHRLSPKDSPVPIGRPIANTQTYILNAHYEPLPLIVPGELYIGGDGLARGYLDSPELTAERFLPNPFKESGARIYKTGDTARYRSDGALVFLGRNDLQVKVRGHRIEPGEIEASLRQHPLVGEAVVTAGNQQSDKLGGAAVGSSESLTAYVVCGGGATTASELRRFLSQRLPPYMIPGAFVFLDALPLTRNGKIDRSALPAPDGTRPELHKRFVPPRTPTEELLAGIWSQVLNIDHIGIHDNFFESGGHSLLATQILARVRDVFDVDVPLRELFDKPNIYAFAEEVENAIAGGKRTDLPPIVPVPRDGPLPLCIAQEQLWYVDQLIGPSHFFNMPYAYRLPGPLNLTALQESLLNVVQRHEPLRTVFPRVDGQPSQIITPRANVSFPLIDLSELPEPQRNEEALRIGNVEASVPFDITTGPLLRIWLLRLAVSEHLLFATMHHIISDDWSMRVFRSDLSKLYEASAHGRPVFLPPLPIQFADFAHWQKNTLQNAFLQDQILYWTKQLAQPLPLLRFPPPTARANSSSFKTSQQPIEIEPHLLPLLKNLAVQEKSTLFMVLLAAANKMMHLTTGQNDIRIGTLVASRKKPELEVLTGHFTNTVVLRTRVSADQSFTQLLRQVRHTSLLAMAHQDLPFEVLLPVLEQTLNIKRRNLFQIMFIYQSLSLPDDLPTPSVLVPDTHSHRGNPETTLTTFDLIFSLKEGSTALTGSLKYKTHRFNPNSVEKMLQVFKSILENAAHPPSKTTGGTSEGLLPHPLHK